MSACPPADEKREEPCADAKQDASRGDEKRQLPSFRPSKQDPFYLGLRLDVRRARRASRKISEKASRRRRRAADPDFRVRDRARRYGLSLADYRAILERQGNACAICKQVRPLCIDHCHVTGQVRGLLCRNCNLALGYCNDDPEVHRTAAAYLDAARRAALLRAADRNQGENGASTDLETRAGNANGGIFRESPGKFTASPMPAASLRPDSPLNPTPSAEALIGGQAAVATAAHPHEGGPGTDEPAAGQPVCR